MPTLGATLAATIAGWMIDAGIADWVDTSTRLVVGLVASTVIFVVTLRQLQRLRDG